MSNDTAIQSLKEKIDDLNQQAWEARVTDLPKSLELSQESVKLARSINYPRGLAEGLRSLGFSYVRFSKNDQAAPLLKESLSLFQSLNDLKGQAVIYEYLGIIERNWGNLGTSLDLLLKANEIVLQTGLLEVEITCSYQLGVTYKHLGNHENALDYLYKTLSLAKKMNFPLMEAYATNIIGSIYFDNGNYKQALDCYQQGLPIRRQSHDKWGEAGSLDNIGFAYLKLNDLNKAIEYCKQSLAICQSTGDKKGEANALLHLAEIYEQAGDIKQAAGFSNESLEIRKERGDKRGESEVLLFLADLYKNRNDVEDHQIFEWLSSALEIAKEIKAQDILSKACYNLHEYHTQKGNYKESLVQLEAHLQIEKELHKNTINQKISNLEISHKAETISQRNKELSELNDQIEKANEELKIERSLERVRTAAMAMKEQADMLEVCKIISDQLEILDVKKIRNVQTAIFYEEKGSYMNYEYYAKHDKLLITEVHYNNHPVAEKFANQMLKGTNQVWTHGFKGEEVKDWLKYQRSTNVFIDTYLETADSLNYYWYSLGPVAMGVSTYVPMNEKEIDLFKRFRNVFELAYRRYLDIEKAQAQAREAQIELALERVRARTMAMHHSGELADTASVLFQQIKELGFETWSCGFCTWTKNDLAEVWMAADSGGLLPPMMIPYKEEPTHSKIYEASLLGEPAHDKVWEGKELEKHYAFLKTIPSVKEAIEILEKSGLSLPSRQCYYVGFFKQGYLLLITKEPNANLKDLSKRFARVFEQTYTRFLDLQKAEAQSREAQIELGLERVRARAMAMQRSDELAELVDIVFKELTKLHFTPDRCIIIIVDEKSRSANYWMANPELQTPTSYHLELKDIPYLIATFNAWKERKTRMVYDLKGDEKSSTVEYIFSKTEFQLLPDEVKQGMKNTNRIFLNSSFNNFGGLQADTIEPLTEENLDIIYRFSKVFDLTYTRFNDLKQAEAQAREARIETALEKVRASTMAMQRSEDLSQTAFVLFNQFKELGEAPERIFIATFDDHEIGVVDLWGTDQGGNKLNKLFKVSVTEPTMVSKIIAAWKEKKRSVVIDLKGEELKTYLGFLKEAGIPVTEGVMTDRRVQTAACFSNGVIGVTTSEPQSAEAVQLQERFAGVFDLTYTRFLDLQKAEAQAREAKIEVALERTRTQSMLMQHSKELDDTLRVFHEQVLLLDINSAFSFLWLPDEGKERHIFWAAWAENVSIDQLAKKDSVVFKSKAINYPLDRNEPATAQCLVDWKGKEPVVSYHVPPAGVESYFAAWQELISGVEQLKPQYFSDGLYYVEAFMKYGCFGVMIESELSEDEKKILGRFAVEFERTYTRFLDLQKAEAQAREALIEAALERVRARALAMQQPEELKDVAQVLRNEMGALGVEELETCSIYIHGDSSENVECWYALQDPKHTEKKMVSDHFVLNLDDTWVGQEMKKFYGSGEKQASIVMQGMNRKEWIKYCYEHSPVFSGFYGDTIPDRTYHLYKFSHGYIGAAAPGDISGESWKLLGRAASVFSLAYSRFKDLTQARNDLIKLKEEKKRAEDALTELQTTQKQLIQAEKMASLGELTAGIAHEIQNPLNFVNNFSDVSNELLEEMKAELEKGNAKEAKAIAVDVKENLEKILHHGKRADAIVKGMLQHSRSSSGQKELTDINVLAEEYLRLAYHGLRAKDKFFNAKFETDLDRSINKINIIPQEIGRVILNLINNSFYAVSEKKRSGSNGYEPSVTVSTKKINDKVEISVRDNGNGIPQKVLDKIFQPFFTTKPTGEGTGLGLSLSYDIVTKGHDGEIKVETKEGEGSAFIISLPMK